MVRGWSSQPTTSKNESAGPDVGDAEIVQDAGEEDEFVVIVGTDSKPLGGSQFMPEQMASVAATGRRNPDKPKEAPVRFRSQRNTLNRTGVDTFDVAITVAAQRNSKETPMRFTASYLAPLLVAGAAAVAITVSPTASASPLTCTDVGSAVQCGSPGNSQVTAVPQYIQQPQQIIIIHRGRR